MNAKCAVTYRRLSSKDCAAQNATGETKEKLSQTNSFFGQERKQATELPCNSAKSHSLLLAASETLPVWRLA